MLTDLEANFNGYSELIKKTKNTSLQHRGTSQIFKLDIGGDVEVLCGLKKFTEMAISVK